MIEMIKYKLTSMMKNHKMILMLRIKNLINNKIQMAIIINLIIVHKIMKILIKINFKIHRIMVKVILHKIMRIQIKKNLLMIKIKVIICKVVNHKMVIEIKMEIM